MSSKVKLQGTLPIPGDKSISHRALIFSALAKGECKIIGLSPAKDCLSTAQCLGKLGITVQGIKKSGDRATSDTSDYLVTSPGLKKLSKPLDTLDAGNSGTTMRILAGLLAGQPFVSKMDGDSSLRSRPMSRVLNPLSQMGAQVTYENGAGMAPFVLSGGSLTGQSFTLNMGSAQVQTALLLAGLQAKGETAVKLPEAVRDHTQRMFRSIAVPFEQKEDGTLSVKQLCEPLPPFMVTVPGDISSASFFMVAAACLPGSILTLKNVGINPGRILVVNVLKRMGADISYQNEREQESGGEPIADIVISGQDRLTGTNIKACEIASGIDEIPILAIAGSLCKGIFRVEGASELKHKESDRLNLIATNLNKAGGSVQLFDDGFEIEGRAAIKGGSFWQTDHDHRLAMCGLIARLLFANPVDIEETASSAISYPDFQSDLNKLVVS